MAYTHTKEYRGITGRELMQLFMRRSYLLVLSLLLCLGLGLIHTAVLAPPLYTATCGIEVDSNEASGKLYEYNKLYRELKILDVCQISLMSDRILQQVIDELGLTESTRELSRRVSVDSDPRSDDILLQVRYEDPNIAASIADRLIELGLERIGQRLEGITVSSFAGPSVSATPETLFPLLSILLSLAAGLILGVLSILFSGSIHPKLTSSVEIPRLFGIPLISSIPRIRRRDVRTLTNRRDSPVFEGCSERIMSFLESNRMLALHLDHHQSLYQGRRLLVTSTQPKEGKSCVALNTAISLSLQAKRVIILTDALDRKVLGSFDSADRKRGAAEQMSDGYVLKEHIIRDPERGIDFLSPDVWAEPSQPGYRKKFTELFEELERLYDVIIIDGPSLRSLEQLHGLATSVDGILFVIREDQATTWEISRAIETLKRITLSPIAAVYNGYSAAGKGSSPSWGEGVQGSPTFPGKRHRALWNPLLSWSLAGLFFLLIVYVSISDPLSTPIGELERHALVLVLFALLEVFLSHALRFSGYPKGGSILLALALGVGSAFGQGALTIDEPLLIAMIPALLGIAVGITGCVLSGCMRSASTFETGADRQRDRKLQLIRTIHPISEDIL